jgi:two-component system CheB/CheR fusion protein
MGERLLRVPWLLRYASAPAAVALVYAVQSTVLPRPKVAPFVLFFAGVAAASWVGGRVPGLIAVGLSAAVANLWFLGETSAWSTSGEELTATGLFIVGAATVALLCAAFRSSLISAQQTAEVLGRQAELLDMSQDAIFVWRPESGIESWNRGAQALYGFDAVEAIGRISHDLLRTVFPKPWPEIEAELCRDRQWEGELVHRTQRLGTVTVWSRMQLVRGSDGVEHVLESTRDITDRKLADEERDWLTIQLDAERRRLATIVEQTPVGIVIADAPSGKIVYANPRLHALVGPGGTGQASWGLRRLDGTPCDPSQLPIPRALRGELVREDLTLPHPGGDPGGLVLSVHAAPVRGASGRITGAIVALQDITDRRRAEEALRATNEKLREADQRKNEFLGMLSHELRNPLAPIRNSLYLLGRAAPGGEQAGRALAVIDRQVHHVTRLVDDLLDVTRITQGKIRLQRERLDLQALARRTVEDYRGLFSKSGVGLELVASPDDIVVNADAIRVAQVIGNLLQNAVKFTPRGGRATLGIERTDDVAVITVRDTGSGIAHEMMPRIFEPFVQAEKTLDRSTGGLGLGLALVKGLVEQHGGSVSVHSAGAGEGATFVVRFPLERRRTPRLSLVPIAPAAGSARRVLVIEDNLDAAETLKEVLELNDHVVDIALSGPEGVEKASALEPDVVLCDIGLPGMDGFQVARAIRSDPRLRGTRLIALSGYAQAEDLERSREAGFDLHLAKPPDLDALEQAIAEVRVRTTDPTPGPVSTSKPGGG